MCGHSRKIVGVMVHVVAIGGLGRTTVAAAIMGDHAITAVEKKQHLGVPIVGRERPTVAEHDGLALAPVLVKNFHAVLRFDKAHVMLPDISVQMNVEWRCFAFTRPRKQAW